MWACLDGARHHLAVGGGRASSLQPGELEATIVRYGRALAQAERGLPANTVLPHLRSRLELLKGLLPVVTSLKNPHLKASHLEALDGALGVKLPRGDELTVSVALGAGLPAHHATVQKVSYDATQEAALLEMLQKVSEQWAATEFVVRPYNDLKDAYVLGSLDEIYATLEETQLVVQGVLASPHVAAIRHAADGWSRRLNTFSECSTSGSRASGCGCTSSRSLAPDLRASCPTSCACSRVSMWRRMRAVADDPTRSRPRVRRTCSSSCRRPTRR